MHFHENWLRVCQSASPIAVVGEPCVTSVAQHAVNEAITHRSAGHTMDNHAHSRPMLQQDIPGIFLPALSGLPLLACTVSHVRHFFVTENSQPVLYQNLPTRHSVLPRESRARMPPTVHCGRHQRLPLSTFRTLPVEFHRSPRTPLLLRLASACLKPSLSSFDVRCRLL